MMDRERGGLVGRTFSKPVARLFGPELIASLKGILLRTLYRGFDVRDWMRPSVVERPAIAPDDAEELADGFGGHNNEVGGAARIGRFKEFLRIRVRPSSVTVHTIAFDDPSSDGDLLKAKLQDVFTLTVKGPPGSP